MDPYTYTMHSITLWLRGAIINKWFNSIAVWPLTCFFGSNLTKQQVFCLQ